MYQILMPYNTKVMMISEYAYHIISEVSNPDNFTM